MTGATIAQLLIIWGPPALELIQKLSTVWTKELTPEEVQAICQSARKSYDDYIAEAKARLSAIAALAPDAAAFD